MTNVAEANTASMGAMDPPGVPRLIVWLCAVIMFINYCDRVNISVAVLAMKEELGWDKITQGNVLGAFFFGYTVSQLLGSMLAMRFGARRMLALAAFGWSLLTVLTPSASRRGIHVVMACRIVLGAFEGMCFPCVFAILGQSKPDKRSANISLQISATYFATVFTLGVAEQMLHHYPWPWIFYSFGGLGFLWLLGWLVLAFPEPMTTLPTPIAAKESLPTSVGHQLTIAFRLLRHRNTMPIFVGHFAHAFCHFLALSWLPTYYAEADAHHSQAGPRSHAMQLAAPYILMTSSSMGGAILADRLIAQGYPRTWVRRSAEALGYGIGAVAMLLFCLCEPGTLASTLLSISIGSSGFSTNGHEAAKLEVVPPELVGMLQGVSNTLAAFSGIIGVPVAAYINHAFDSWKAVFAMVGTVYAVAGLIFWRFGTAEQIPRAALVHA